MMPETPKEAARRLGAGLERDGYRPEHFHEYTRPDGSPWWWVLRWRHPETRQKEVRPLRQEPDGSYSFKRPEFGPEGAPLYGLGTLARYPDEVAYLVEGEACADCLEGLGFVATTWPGGAKAIGKADLRPLAGRSVLLWADNDQPGREAMQEARALLHKLGAVALILDTRGLALPPKGDAVDWVRALATRHGARNLSEVSQGIEDAAQVIRSLPCDLGEYEGRLAA